MQYSVRELQEYYVNFEIEFTLFFDEIKQFATDKLAEITHDFSN